MAEEKDAKDKSGEGDTGDKNAVTLESLAAALETQKVSQDEVIEALRADGVNNVTRLEQVIRDRDGDIQNLTNLLGNLGKQEEGAGEEDYTEMTKGKVEDIVANTISESKKAETAAKKDANDAYWDTYASEVQEHQGAEGPDGKPLSKEAREGIMELLKTTVIDKTKNPTKDAYKNHREATKIYFGLGKKEHGFKGGSVAGTGSGGGGFKEGTKTSRTFSDAQKEEFKELGVSEEWANKVLDKKKEEEVTY